MFAGPWCCKASYAGGLLGLQQAKRKQASNAAVFQRALMSERLSDSMSRA